jgi:hypothetical protein
MQIMLSGKEKGVIILDSMQNKVHVEKGTEELRKPYQDHIISESYHSRLIS